MSLSLPASIALYVSAANRNAPQSAKDCFTEDAVVQDWSKEAAVREMQDGGFGFHRVWTNLPDWIRDLDVESLREEAGIAAIGKPSAEMQQ